jgi:EAL domain-containing protein (putative c-di-GMP-specific phosphodiesterase class I)
VLRAVDAPGFEALAYVGASLSLQDVYCQHILDGRLPELIPDTADEPLALALPITQAVPIGSHVSIPIRRLDATPYGMFCCLSTKANRTLNDRDLHVMRAFGELAAHEINGAIAERSLRQEIADRLDQATANGSVAMAYQPIFDLASPVPGGFEALCRFATTPYRTPDIWFSEAALIGRQVELERSAIALALDALRTLPDHVYLSINASPDTVLTGGLDQLFRGHACERIVLELTERAAVRCYDALTRAVEPLRFWGVRLAIDDAGAGYSGLQHVVRLRPDIIKLDMTLTRGIDTDPPRRALAAAMVHFAAETGAVIVAEGIETEAELAVLRALGIHRGQGYLLGKPQDLVAARGWFESEQRRSA